MSHGDNRSDPETSSSVSVSYWDQVAHGWQETHPQRLWRTYSDTVYQSLLCRWLPPCRVNTLLKTDLFDESVNPGLYPVLAARAHQVFGIDVATEVVRVARARFPQLRAIRADVRRLPFTDNAFDVIVSPSTLDHFHTLAELILSFAELRRVLRPGGHLILSLDNLANPLIALRNALPFRLLNRLGLVPYRVGQTCGPLRLRQLLTQTGFTVLQMSSLVHHPRVLGVALSRLFERYANEKLQQHCVRFLMRCDTLWGRLGRYVTGHYVVVKAT